ALRGQLRAPGRHCREHNVSGCTGRRRGEDRVGAGGGELMTTMLPKATGVEFDATSRQLLDLMQEDFPLVDRPYAALGERLGISETEELERLREARAAGVVRQICAIYDTKALGSSSALVAMSVPAERLSRAAAIVNAHPGVSHNYKRN